MRRRKSIARALPLTLTAVFLALAVVTTGLAAELDDLLAEQAKLPLIRSAIGVTREGTAIPCLIHEEDLDFNTAKTRILIVAGLAGADGSTKKAIEGLNWFYTSDDAAPLRKRFVVSCVPCGNPDGLAAGRTGANASGGNPATGYPPAGEAYNSKTDPEAQYLWRWIGMHAPDAVIEWHGGTELQAITAAKELLGHVRKVPVAELSDHEKQERAAELFVQLGKVAPCNTGTIPALRVACPKGGAPTFLQALLKGLAEQTPPLGVSPARRELQSRLARTPVEVATQLSKVYGHELKQVAYIPAMALVGRVRLGELTNDGSQLADVEKVVAAHLQNKPTVTAKSAGSDVAGYQIFSLLAEKIPQRKAEYLALAKAAADVGFDSAGEPLSSMPSHNEMSDAVFMGCSILAQVGKLTGDKKYYDQCLRHLRFMLKLNLRADGLHRHSPLDEAAWGRGNGFPALGLALALTELPDDYAGRSEVLTALSNHLAALAPHQDPTGCWHQVVDRPESYRELSSTSMIAFAMARGVRLGWLPREKYDPLIRRAWYAIRTRLAADGSVVDVCTGTGKQKSLRDYYDRGAILGRDGRGGAMALLVATEIAAWERSSPGFRPGK